MIILIVAIVIALVLFAVLRKLAIPVILLLGAGYLYTQVKEYFHAPITHAEGSVSGEAQPSFSVPMPLSEATVCKMLEYARDNFGTLKAEFEAGDSEQNAIRRDQLVAQARTKIDRLYSDRNRAVLSTIGWDEPRFRLWTVKVTKVSTVAKDDGTGSASFATLESVMPCQITVVVTSEEFPAASRMGETLASVNSGDTVVVSGRFVKHDEAMNPPEVAVEWGGPIYGPLGGLWTDAIDAPAFRIELTDIARVTR